MAPFIILVFSFKWAPSNIYQLHHLEILLHILYISYSQIMTLKEKVSNTSTNLSGYWNINSCPPPLIWTSHESGIFSTILTEFARGEVISSVPATTDVGLFMFDSLSQASHLPAAAHWRRRFLCCQTEIAFE
jgi:hypothetical protein